MANEEITAPVVEAAPVAAPAVEAAPAPAVVEAPVAPVIEAAPEVVVEAPKVETVLGEALNTEASKTEPEKPAAETTEAKTPVEGEKPKTEEVKQEGQSEEPAPPPVYDAFTLPEGFTLDEAQTKQFTDVLAELETTGKIDHALVQQFGQKAVDLHTSLMKQAQEDLTKFYQTSWDRQKTEWRDTFLKDPEIGGNRFETTVNEALTFIRTHGGTADQQTEFKNLMETSGLGNHPAMIRLLANAGRVMSEGRPLAATTPVAPPKSKVSTLYGKNA